MPLEMAERAARAAAGKKAREVVVLDVREQFPITDYFVICSGSSDRQVKTIADEVNVRLKQAGVAPLRREGVHEARWVLLDYADVVVHIFSEQDRAYYDLERLWKDAPRVDVTDLEEATG